MEKLFLESNLQVSDESIMKGTGFKAGRRKSGWSGLSLPGAMRRVQQ